jgi:hypothetical protein
VPDELQSFRATGSASDFQVQILGDISILASISLDAQDISDIITPYLENPVHGSVEASQQEPIPLGRNPRNAQYCQTMCERIPGYHVSRWTVSAWLQDCIEP